MSGVRVEFVYHDNRALTGLFVGFPAPGSFGYGVFIYSGQALAVLKHFCLFPGSPPFPFFLLGFPHNLVPVWGLLVHHLISYEPRIKSRSP